MSDSYTLYIHESETEIDIDDDMYEPAAFQIPYHMEWKDLQDLISCEVGRCTFTYLDDENDKVKIGSQDEYEIAINLTRKSKRDLHIYASKLNQGQVEGQRREEKKKLEDNTFVNPYEAKEEEVEILRPPENPRDVTETQRPVYCTDAFPSNEEESLGNQGAAAPLYQDDVVSSSVPDEQETRPMPVVNPIITLIKKEVKEMMGKELDDIWKYVNCMKKDMDEKLDTIGEHLVAEVQTKQNQGSNEEEKAGQEDDSARSIDNSLGTENDFAARFVCESLQDGSIVQTGSAFEKYWVFRNEGSATWDEGTKLHLLEESCTPSAYSGDSLSEWGAKNKSVGMPSLKLGQSGVVCVEHVAPRHNCDYNSSWRLSHDGNAFGPRVWCNVRVVDGSQTPVDSLSFESAKNQEAFEILNGESTSVEKDTPAVDTPTEKDTQPPQEEAKEQSLVPPEKLDIAASTTNSEVPEHCDNSILSFNMADIGDGTKFLPPSKQEEVPYNPAVSTVSHEKEEECLHDQNQETVHEEASVDAVVHDERDSTSSPESMVMIQPRELEEEKVEEQEQNPEEFPTLEAENEKEEAEKKVEEVENFTEQVVMTPDHESDSDFDQDAEEEEYEEHEEQQGNESNDDLHSVDFNLDDASMTSYDVSDFVVVPLPECFDVNRPLNVSQTEITDKLPSAEAETQTTVEIPQHESIQNPPDPEGETRGADSDEESDEFDSQPNSRTHAKEYQSEDSLSTAPKAPSSGQNSEPTTPNASLPARVNLAPAFQPPEIEQPPQVNEPTNQPQSSSSLHDAITQNFQAFTISPEKPQPPTVKPKIPMNQLPTSKTTTYTPPAPIPVPKSVVSMDEPYVFQPCSNPQFFPPFEQGWRQNPIPVPTSVTDEHPWTLPTYNPQPLPQSEFTLNRNSNGIGSILPAQPFAVPRSLSGASEGGMSPPNRQQPTLDGPAVMHPPRRPPSPIIALPDDFYPVPTETMEVDDEFQTPPPSPPPAIRPTALDRIYEMGFHDMELNQEMFERCQHDINRTVQALVLRMEADNGME